MKPRIRVGLIVGVIGLIVNVAVAALVGICGPGLSLVAGALAGFYTARQEQPATKNDGARAGAVSGGIAGLLITIGQVVGAASALAYMQYSGTASPFGTIPAPSADVGAQAIYYLSGVGAGICFGLIGAILAAAAGAATGYANTPAHVPPLNNPLTNQ
jgi:hypothetical protein